MQKPNRTLLMLESETLESTPYSEKWPRDLLDVGTYIKALRYEKGTQKIISILGMKKILKKVISILGYQILRENRLSLRYEHFQSLICAYERLLNDLNGENLISHNTMRLKLRLSVIV